MTRRHAIAFGLLLACCRLSVALNPSLDISQYARTSWTVRDRLFKGTISVMAQTPDGYLWLGTDYGLLRFDGVRTLPWQPAQGEHLKSDSIRALRVARDGSLWIGTLNELVSWKDGKLTRYPQFDGQNISVVFEDRKGVLWVGNNAVSGNAKLCAFRGARADCFGEDGAFGSWAGWMYEDSVGLWVASEKGLWHWAPGSPKLYPMPEPESDLQEVIRGEDERPWIATRGGIRRLIDDKVIEYPLLGKQQFRAKRLLRDRDGGMWIGTADRGLLHTSHRGTDAFSRADGLSSDSVAAIFEDHEGSVWVATNGGLDRFRDFAVPTYSLRQGLSNGQNDAVLAARDGSLWLTSITGLNHWQDVKNSGARTVYRNKSLSREEPDVSLIDAGPREMVDPGLASSAIESLLEDSRGRIWASTPNGLSIFENGRFVRGSDVPQQVYGMAEDGPESLWLNDRTGLIHLEKGQVTSRIPWADFGRDDAAMAMARDPVKGGLWIGFFRGGIVYFEDGKVRKSLETSGRTAQFYFDGEGQGWAATEGGLVRFSMQRTDTLSSRNGLPCDGVQSMVEDSSRALWLRTACGIVRISQNDLQAWVKDPGHKIQATIFDESDGVLTRASAGGYTPRSARTADGRLWFAFMEGVGMIDPDHLPINKIPPPVYVEQIIAGRKPRWDSMSGGSSTLRLPPLVGDLEIDYTALSLVAPEKIRFRYKLEGHDSDWQDAGNRRQAFYNDLPPRKYTFRVTACNNSGVWNEAGAAFDFSVAPTYYQSLWFQVICGLVGIVLLWGLYQFRLHRIAHEFDMRLDERVKERERIARELHDTLLQSFQGTLIRFQAARNLFTRRPEAAMQTLDEAIDKAEGAIIEGREAIHDLRSEPLGQSDLEHLLIAVGEELSAAQFAGGEAPYFRVTVEGAREALSPLLQDELYRIAREVLRNAFVHAGARRIEAEIRYDDRLLRLRIRDDGKGIDHKVLEQGARDGHWGLPGIRERAKRIGGRLDFWSETGAGTEVELSVPGLIAYAKPPTGRALKNGFKLFRKKTGSS